MKIIETKIYKTKTRNYPKFHVHSLITIVEKLGRVIPSYHYNETRYHYDIILLHAFTRFSYPDRDCVSISHAATEAHSKSVMCGNGIPSVGEREWVVVGNASAALLPGCYSPYTLHCKHTRESR